MFDGIKSVFLPPREAQATDTRLEIKRHDPDHDRKKRDKRKKTTQELFEEADGATVSVDALHVFLETFLKSQKAVADESFTAAATGVRDTNSDEVQISQASEKSLKNDKKRPSGMAARAAQTYQTMANWHEPQREHILGDASLDKGPEISLSSADIRSIHQLLQDLKKLEARNIHYLRIEKGENFLQSIISAVAKVS